MPTTNVALLGLGIMGSGMGRNILKAGFPLTVYNRTPAKAQPLADHGAHIAATPREAAAGAQIIISMVGDDDASRAVWLGADGALAAAAEDAVLVECSTLSAAWGRELAALAQERGLAFLDAPVTGSKDAAQNGELHLLIGGDAATLERARPVLEAISRRISHLGPSGSGTLTKIVNNLIAAAHAAALAEGLVLAERAGLDMDAVLPVLINGANGSPLVKGKAARMIARDYDDTHFALRWMHKDASYGLAAAAEHSIAMPTLAAARDVYGKAAALGLSDADFAAVIEAIRK